MKSLRLPCSKQVCMLMLFGISILPIAVIIFPPAVTLVSGPMQNSFVHWVWLSLLVSKWNLRSRLTRLVPICRACHVTYHQNISSMNLRLNVVLIFWNDQKTSTCKYLEKMLSIDHVTRSLTCDISSIEWISTSRLVTSLELWTVLVLHNFHSGFKSYTSLSPINFSSWPI